MTSIFRRLLLASALALPSVAYADTVLPDPLHGMVCAPGGAGCNTDKGSFSPITPGSNGLISSFGWASSPAGESALEIFLLIPHALNRTFNDASTTGTGLPVGGSAPGFVGLYTPGDLASFVGLGTASPASPFNGFQIGTDTAATGFDVYEINAGTETLAGVSSP